MNKRITTGIIGAGRIGRKHAENIKRYIPYADIKTVADVLADDIKIKEWTKSIGVTNLIKDPDDLINDKDIDAIIICSPTDTHAKYVIAAAKAGKDIFCEKPIDLNIDRIKEALKFVKESKVKFQIGFNRRYDHNFKRAHDIISSGEIGNVYLIKITAWDPQPPSLEYNKTCGGIFLDMTIHDFDMARFLSGSEVTEVYSNASVLIDPDIGKICNDYDTAITTLKFASGAIGVIDNCRQVAHGYDQRVEVLGSKAAVSIKNDTSTTAILYTNEYICSEKPLPFFLERFSGAYIEEIKDFYDCILNNKETSTSLVDGLRPIEIGMAALMSARENRPVKIEEIE